MQERERRRRQSGITAGEWERCTFDRFDLAVNPGMAAPATAAAEWGIGQGPPFLVLQGETRGTGKTHLAIAGAGLWIDQGATVVFAVVPELLEQLRSTQRRFSEDGPVPPGLEALQRRYGSAPVLVLDELGAGRETDFADEQLGLIINARWRERLPTCITTNVRPERIEERTRSRICDWQVSRVLVCTGRDYRGLRR